MMRSRVERRFGLIDAMILLAATAAGLAWGRDHWLGAFFDLATPGGPWNPPWDSASRLLSFSSGAARLLVCWSVALLVLLLRAPRPRRALLARQPGTLAAAMATAYTAAIAISFLLAYLIRSKYKPTWSDYSGQAISYPGTALAIAAAWMVLAASGRWRVGPGWIDRMGVALGLSWIALVVAGHFFDWR